MPGHVRTFPPVPSPASRAKRAGVGTALRSPRWSWPLAKTQLCSGQESLVWEGDPVYLLLIHVVGNVYKRPIVGTGETIFVADNGDINRRDLVRECFLLRSLSALCLKLVINFIYKYQSLLSRRILACGVLSLL